MRWRGEVMRPRVRVKASRGHLPAMPRAGRPEFVSAVDEDSPLAAEPLSRVGIPPYDIVRIDGAAESGFFLLAADRGECATGWGIGR